MIAFLIPPLVILGAVLFVHQPLLLCAVIILFLPAVYAMLTGAPTVPTGRNNMDTMFNLANIKKGERVYDLGCGDGRFVFAAAKKGADATGFELSLLVYLYAKILSFFRGGSIRCRNFWKQDISDADVVFCFLLTSSMQTFKSTLWPTLKPGTRVVSHAFAMQGIEPKEHIGDVRLYVK